MRPVAWSDVRIVHVKRGDPFSVYVGRGPHGTFRWGNPFRVGEDGTREEVLAKYDGYLREHPEIIDEAKRELAGKSLACWCAPKGGVGLDDPVIGHCQPLARAARGDYD
jgi:hypothetical protein